jgi:hypothetical protein
MDENNTTLSPLTDSILAGMNMEALMDEQNVTEQNATVTEQPNVTPADPEQERNGRLQSLRNAFLALADMVRLNRWNEFFGQKPEIDVPLEVMRARFDAEVERRDGLQTVFEVLAKTHREMCPPREGYMVKDDDGTMVQEQHGPGTSVMVVAELYGRKLLGEISGFHRARGRYGRTTLKVREFPTSEEEVLDWKSPHLASLRVCRLAEVQGLIEEATRGAVLAEVQEYTG